MKLLVSILVFLSISFAQSVSVSYQTCAKVLEIMTDMKNKRMKSHVERKIDNLLSHKDYKGFFLFHQSSNHYPVNKTNLKKMILSLKWNKEHPRGKNRKLDAMQQYWMRVYNNLSHFRQKINQLQKINLKALIQNSVRTANSWLPPSMRKYRFNFVVLPDGQSAAYKVQNYQVYDIFQIPIDRLGNIDKDLLAEIIAHESHHSGLKLEIRSNDFKKRNLIYFLSHFLMEGSATKLVNNVYGKYVEKINPKKEIKYFKAIPGINIEREWRKMFSSEDQMFSRFFSTITKILNGSMSQSAVQRELNSYWLSYGSAKHYLIGSEIIGAIYIGFGKSGCFEVMKDPLKLIPKYQQAVQKNRYRLKKCPQVPKELLALF